MLGGDSGDVGLGAVAAGDAEKIRAVGERLPGDRGHVLVMRVSSSTTRQPSASALATRPKRPTLPPPAAGFMISVGRSGGGVLRTCASSSARSARSAARPQARPAAQARAVPRTRSHLTDEPA